MSDKREAKIARVIQRFTVGGEEYAVTRITHHRDMGYSYSRVHGRNENGSTAIYLAGHLSTGEAV